MSVMSIVNDLRKALGLDGVRYIGLIGSYARGRRRAGDIDVLLVTDKKLDPSRLVGLTKRNVALTTFTVNELEEAPPDLKYSILHDSVPVYGSLEGIGVALEVAPRELLEWISRDPAHRG